MAFSRLQLAAALIEYDNDDPTAGPPRKASESAILAARARARPGAAARQAARGYQPSTVNTTAQGDDGNDAPGAQDRRRSRALSSPRSPDLALGNGVNEASSSSLSNNFRDPRGSTRMSMAGPGYYQRQLQMLQAEEDARRQQEQKRRSTATSASGSREELQDDQRGAMGGSTVADQVDISTWGLPDSLVAPDRGPSSSASSSSTGHGSRPRTTGPRSGSVTPRPPSRLRTSSVIDLGSPVEEKQLHEALGGVAFPGSNTGGVQPLSPGLERAIQQLPATEPHVDLSQHPSPPRPADGGGAEASSVTATGGPRRRGRAGRTVSFSDWDGMIAGKPTNGGDPGDDRPLSRASILDRPRPRVSFDSAGPVPTLHRPVSFVALNDVDSNRRPAHGRAASDGGKIPGRLYATSGQSPTSPSFREEVLVEEDQEGADDADGPNPFALPAPSGHRTSRFDPKAAEAQHRASRRMSGASDLDRHESNRPTGARRDSRYSARSGDLHPDEVRKSILRPKTLIMPAPLHGAARPAGEAADPSHLRGFQRGERPLPPGALTRPDSFVGTLEARTARASKLFTDSLPVDGKRGEHFIGGAATDGELKFQSFGESPPQQVELLDDQAGHGRSDVQTDEDWRPNVRTMKGLSLMDRIEARKAEMKGKQRVFTGDARPSMMSRSISQPVLLAPEDGLRESPALSPMSADHRPLPGDLSVGSLPRVDSNGPVNEAANALMGQRPGMPNTRSVFGVDEVWQRELEKLRAQEEHEKELARQEEEKAQRKQRKKKNKGKERDLEQPAIVDSPSDENRPSTSIDPPTLDVNLPSEQEPQKHAESAALAPALGVDEWAAASDGDSDEDGDKKLRRPVRKVKPSQTTSRNSDSSSEDDVPLSRAFVRKAVPAGDQSSDDEEPLSRLKATQKEYPAAGHRENEDDDDDRPLGLRLHSRTLGGDEEEDDLPLGQRHQLAAQQQQHQRFSMMAQQQQQQQMMMGGFPSPFGPPAMGMPAFSPFGGPMPLPFNASMGSLPHFGFPGTPMGIGGPPPLDPAIDRWRREVVERDSMSTLSGSHGPEGSQRSRSVMS